jgi:hypothetical protein
VEADEVFTRAQLRAAARVSMTVLAALLVWFALVAPNDLRDFSASAFLRIPLEGVIIAAVLVLLPPRPRLVAAAALGAVLGVLTILKLLDMGFYEALDRPFNPVTDRTYLGPAVEVLDDSVGQPTATIAVVVVILVALAIPVLTAVAAVRLSRLAALHKSGTVQGMTALAAVWAVLAVFGAPVASSSAAGLAYDQVEAVRGAIHEQDVFAERLANDPYADVPGSRLLRGLRGKDVIVAFVESYGRCAVEGSTFSAGVNAVLDAGTQELSDAGFRTESAWLTSPTFGGISWLAHSTLQSGLWIDNQLLYDDLMASDRLTLSKAFERAGWSTVVDVPSNADWPEAKSFYGYDRVYGVADVGYHGPSFSFASMPDQYTLDAFQRLELAEPHNPVFAELDLVSSHTPWAPLPHMIDWDNVGDGKSFNTMAAEGASPDEVWRDTDDIRAAYGQSIEYSLSALISFVRHFGDKNLVLILLGDHQPAKVVSGENPSHDVPITIVAHDRGVMRQISGWGWEPGMRPSADAPRWPMDAFRDRLLTAYSPGLAQN